MGLLSWLFPSDEDRIAKAHALLGDERWADARLEVLDIARPEAETIVAIAESQLAKINLEAAISWAEAGDAHRVVVHMELAEQFHAGGLEEEFREARRRMRELRAERSEAEKRELEEKKARLMSVDPFGLGGGPSLLADQLPEGMDGEDAMELAARLDLLIEGYPEDLRSRVGDLGPDFARAVLDLDSGRADLALQTLLALDEDDPLVIWETARAANALGDPSAAARTLRRFPDVAGGHREIGNQHTAVVLAQALAESGDPAAGLRVLRDARATDPKVGGFLFAQLLTSQRELPEAETVTRELIKGNGRYLPYYALLANIRLMGGYRVEAMTALERAMSLTCGTPGQCGYMKPDPGIVRTLATLYLEDGIEVPRGIELAEQARGMSANPGWADRYLEALVARQQGDVDAGDLAERLWDGLPETDPRRERLEKHLPSS